MCFGVPSTQGVAQQEALGRDAVAINRSGTPVEHHVGEEVATTPEDAIRFDVPLYTVAEAARALGVPASTFVTWAFGYARRRADGRVQRGAPIVTATGVRPGASIPFVGLAEGMVLAAIRRAGVPLQRVRPALDLLQTEIGLEHALASRRLYTDGAELLYDHAAVLPEDDAAAVHELVVVRSGQRVFSDIVEEYLKRIEYGRDGYAQVILLPAYERAHVIADPTRSFGQPIFSSGGARVSDVVDRFLSGEDIHSLIKEFGVPEAEIEDVIRAASRRAA